MAETDILTEADARHLLRRATFGPIHRDVESITGRSRGEAADRLLSYKPSGFTPKGDEHADIHAKWLKYLEWALDHGGGNTRYSQSAADGFRSTDLRDVYGTILKHWVNLPPEAIGLLLPADSPTPLDFLWTEPNYDLGFV